MTFSWAEETYVFHLERILREGPLLYFFFLILTFSSFTSTFWLGTTMYSRPVCSLRPAKATPSPLVHTSGPTTAHSFEADEEQGARRTQLVYLTPSPPSSPTSLVGNRCCLHPGGQHGGGMPETQHGCDRASLRNKGYLNHRGSERGARSR